MFNERQKEAHRLALDDSVHSLFITGEGGTGKTQVAKQIIKDLKGLDKSVVVIAPTHSAAKNLPCGQTIASFFKLAPTLNFLAESEDEALNFRSDDIDYDEFEGKTVIVDEASMIGEKQFDELLARLRVKKLIIIGDPEQLAPIKDTPFNWEAFCDKTVVLNVNYRTTNEKSKKVIAAFLENGKMILPFSKKLKYEKDTVYIAHKNKTLSDMQNSVLGYTTCRPKDRLLVFGNCDTHLRKSVNQCSHAKNVEPYFVNNDVVLAQSEPFPFAKDLYEVDVIAEDKKVALPKDKWSPQYPVVIVGDYDAYKKLLEEKFKPAKNLVRQMQKKYKTKNTSTLKSRMVNSELKMWNSLWANYMRMKSKPYARHAQFRTTYKSQGKSFKNVVVVWGELPNNKHRYVAISRAINKLEVI
jgi:hypothetical protein